MSENKKPVEPKKKLDLNKESIQELNEEELDKVAGGAKTVGGRCQAQSLAPACPAPESDQCAIPTVGCGPLPDPPTIIAVGNCPAPVTD